MSKKIILFLFVCLCLFTVLASSVSASGAVKNNSGGISDKNLYRAVLKTLGKKKNETFTKQEAAGLKKLDLSESKIKTLKGIECFKQLNELYLNDNRLTRAKELSKLVNLKILDVSGNNLADLQWVKKLKKLEYLKAAHNKIRSIEPIKALKNLKYLFLEFNEISSLAGLSPQMKLKTLDVSQNNLTDIKEISLLTNLRSFGAAGNRIESLQGIAKQTKLDSINLDSNNLENLSGIQNLKNLSVLSANNNRLTNADDIVSLKKLQFFYVRQNKLATLPDVSAMPNLESADLLFNQLSREEMQAKLPPSWFKVSPKVWNSYIPFYQNMDYTVEITEPAGIENIHSGTVKIAGRIFMPAQKVCLSLGTSRFYGEEGHWIEADADENGRFVFEGLNLDGYVSFDLRIQCRHDESGAIEDASSRLYKIRNSSAFGSTVTGILR